MKLSELENIPGSNKSRKRVGRGPGSGHGKTSCRGHKGQKARSGAGRKPWFEGGQMPLQRRLPKRGFTNKFKRVYAIINVKDLDVFLANSVVTPQEILEKRLVSKIVDGVKILGEGEIKKPLTVKAHRFSQAAASKITAAGGSIAEI